MPVVTFLEEHPIVAILLGVIIVFVILKMTPWRSIKFGKGGFQIDSRNDKFSAEALMLENQVLRRITIRISDLEGRILLQRQMAVVEEFVDIIIAMYSDFFRKFLDQLGVSNGVVYDEMLHDNERVNAEIRKGLVNKFRIAMRQNGFTHMDENELEDYVHGKFESMNLFMDEVRSQVSTNTKTVSVDFLEWFGPYKQEFLIPIEHTFKRCRKIAQDCETEIQILHSRYKQIEVHFMETGKVESLPEIIKE